MTTSKKTHKRYTLRTKEETDMLKLDSQGVLRQRAIHTEDMDDEELEEIVDANSKPTKVKFDVFTDKDVDENDDESSTEDETAIATLLKGIGMGGISEVYLGKVDRFELLNPEEKEYVVKTLVFSEHGIIDGGDSLYNRFMRESRFQKQLAEQFPEQFAKVYGVRRGFEERVRVKPKVEKRINDIESALNAELSLEQKKRNVSKIEELQIELDRERKDLANIEAGQTVLIEVMPKDKIFDSKVGYAAFVMEYAKGAVDLDDIANEILRQTGREELIAEIVTEAPSKEGESPRMKVEYNERLNLPRGEKHLEKLLAEKSENFVKDEFYVPKEEIDGSLSVVQRYMIARLAVNSLFNMHEKFVYTSNDGKQHKGIVHRDIKSANYMLTSRGNLLTLDLGVSIIVGMKDEDSSSSQSHTVANRLTSANESLGTSFYLPPELTGKMDEPDKRSDIWSLGITFFRLFTGRYKFDYDRFLKGITDNKQQINIKNSVLGGIMVQYEYQPWVRDFNGDVSKHLEFLIETMIVPDYEMRPRSSDIESELHQLMNIDGGILHRELTAEEHAEREKEVSMLYDRIAEYQLRVVSRALSKHVSKSVVGVFDGTFGIGKNINLNDTVKEKVKEEMKQLMADYNRLTELALTDNTDGASRLGLFKRAKRIAELFGNADDAYRLNYKMQIEDRRLKHYRITADDSRYNEAVKDYVANPEQFSTPEGIEAFLESRKQKAEEIDTVFTFEEDHENKDESEKPLTKNQENAEDKESEYQTSDIPISVWVEYNDFLERAVFDRSSSKADTEPSVPAIKKDTRSYDLKIRNILSSLERRLSSLERRVSDISLSDETGIHKLQDELINYVKLMPEEQAGQAGRLAYRLANRLADK